MFWINKTSWQVRDSKVHSATKERLTLVAKRSWLVDVQIRGPTDHTRAVIAQLSFVPIIESIAMRIKTWARII